MDVVGHQHIGVNGAVMLVRGESEPFVIKAIILVFEKDGLAIVTALDHVQRLIRHKIAPSGPSPTPLAQTIMPVSSE
jgi:hypothetical protein